LSDSSVSGDVAKPCSWWTSCDLYGSYGGVCCQERVAKPVSLIEEPPGLGRQWRLQWLCMMWQSRARVSESLKSLLLVLPRMSQLLWTVFTTLCSNHFSWLGEALNKF
jgi:hypothetical protein